MRTAGANAKFAYYSPEVGIGLLNSIASRYLMFRWISSSGLATGTGITRGGVGSYAQWGIGQMSQISFSRIPVEPHFLLNPNRAALPFSQFPVAHLALRQQSYVAYCGSRIFAGGHARFGGAIFLEREMKQKVLFATPRFRRTRFP